MAAPGLQARQRAAPADGARSTGSTQGSVTAYVVIGRWYANFRDETSNFKLQTPQKHRDSNTKPSLAQPSAWNLELDVSLEFGVWCLGFLVRQRPTLPSSRAGSADEPDDHPAED